MTMLLIELLTKEVGGYPGDSFFSFLFGKAIIEADLVVKGSKALTHNEVMGSLYLLLYTAHHCAEHGEGGRVSFFLNKAIQDKGASQDTKNLLEKAIQASQYEPTTDSFAFPIGGFSINDSGILSPSASKDLGCTLGQSTCSWDSGAKETHEHLDAHEKQHLELAMLASYQQSAQDPSVEHTESAVDMKARVDALEAQVRTLSARLEEGVASHLPPPPYEEVRRDEETQQPLAGDVEGKEATY